MPFDELTRKHLEKLSATIRQVMSEKNLSNTGGAAESLEVKGNQLLGNDYLYFLDKGRAPGKFPPVATIRDWVRSKLEVDGKEVNSVAYLVGRKMQRDGTEIYKDKSKGIQLDTIVEQMLEELYKELPEQAVIDIQKYL